MNEKAAKGLVLFLLVMAFFTLVSWKLDLLRTPQVLCAEPVQMALAEELYYCVLPAEAVREEYVWVVGESKSAFYAFTTRDARVVERASEDGWTAVDGISNLSLVVWFSDRLLGSGTVPVRLWEARPLAGRVEVLCPPEGEEALRASMDRFQREWDLSWEEDRLVVENVDLFTAQQVEVVLGQAGVEALVLDYAWGPAVLAQSGRLWLVWAVLLGLLLLGSLLWDQLRLELERAREGLEDSYLGRYLESNGVRLLAKSIALAAAFFAAILALRWLWEVPVELPRGFLPEGSVFQWAYYRQWIAAAFPEGLLSDYGAELAEELRRGYLLSAAAAAGLTVLAGLVKFLKKSDNRIFQAVGR